MYYTIEYKDLDEQESTWQPVEERLLIPKVFALPELAEAVARTLALRSPSNAAFRVVDDARNVIVETQVNHYLRVSRPQSSIPLVLEAIPPHFIAPILSTVLLDADERASVFLLRSAREATDLQSTLTKLTLCLIDWLALDEDGCTCDGPSGLCLTCSSHQAVMRARSWLQQLVPDQVSDDREKQTPYDHTTEKEREE